MTQSTAAAPAGFVRDLYDVLRKEAIPHAEWPSIVRRRRIIVGIVLVLGAVVLSVSLQQPKGDVSFYWWTMLLASLWAAGAFSSGPLHLGCICWRGRNQRPWLVGITVGTLLGIVFLVGGLIIREIPPLADYIRDVLDYANAGWLPLVVAITVINGIAEELFFRGSLFSATRTLRPVLISTVLYVIATLASGNPMLGFAAIILGTVNAIQRRATGGVLAPILTHFIWGLIMVLALPPIFGL